MNRKIKKDGEKDGTFSPSFNTHSKEISAKIEYEK